MFSFNSLLMLCALTLAGCPLSNAEPSSTTAPSGTRPRIVILGDSITAGYGLSPDEAYPAVLQQKINDAHLDYQVVNAGLSGDTTAGGLRRVDWSLSGGADVLIIALGGNDRLRGLPPKETESNLDAIIRKARETIPGITIIVAGMMMPPSMGEDFVRAFDAVFPQVAEENHVGLVPFLLKDVGGIERLNQPDMIHPTAEGQRIVADNVWSVLRGALKK